MNAIMERLMAGGPLAYQLLRLLGTITIDHYARKRFIKLGILPTLFGILKTTNYIAHVECVFILSNYIHDDVVMKEVGKHLVMYTFAIPILLNFLEAESESVALIGLRMLSHMLQYEKGRQRLQQYNINLEALERREERRKLNTSHLESTFKAIQRAQLAKATSQLKKVVDDTTSETPVDAYQPDMYYNKATVSPRTKRKLELLSESSTLAGIQKEYA